MIYIYLSSLQKCQSEPFQLLNCKKHKLVRCELSGLPYCLWSSRTVSSIMFKETWPSLQLKTDPRRRSRYVSSSLKQIKNRLLQVGMFKTGIVKLNTTTVNRKKKKKGKKPLSLSGTVHLYVEYIGAVYWRQRIISSLPPNVFVLCFFPLFCALFVFFILHFIFFSFCKIKETKQKQ